MGLITYGRDDSPFVPILSCFYSKTAALVRFLREKDIASAGVVYPVTPFLECRMRVCLSAGHSKEQLDYALKVIAEAVDQLGLNYSKSSRGFIEY
ncbi:hypothetical protein PPYR_12626 [Photinus pyralis]|uniref:Aminotransferase class I/classII domain-containing protein n=1 Tax=Photinus pyralis TaxID=7054 RepID=A0A5N4A6Q2_PHOPY|nr:hypothetical protein PPYR_12626 [Photinus pyralis]